MDQCNPFFGKMAKNHLFKLYAVYIDLKPVNYGTEYIETTCLI